MSTAEIADNKWEVQSAKPPFGLSGLSQIILFGGFVLLFGWIAAMSVVAIVTPKKDNSLEESYRKMKQGDNAPAAPAEK